MYGNVIVLPATDGTNVLFPKVATVPSAISTLASNVNTISPVAETSSALFAGREESNRGALPGSTPFCTPVI